MEAQVASGRAALACALAALALASGSCDFGARDRQGSGAGGKADDLGCGARARLEPFAGDLRFDQPVALVQNPQNELRWYVVERTGKISTFLKLTSSVTSPRVFADLGDRVESEPGEAGLLGLAFHPRFSDTGEVFVSYTAPDPDSPSGLESRVSRFSSENGRALDPGSEEILLRVGQPHANHNGGHIAFGPDGFLYVGLGDGGGAGDPEQNGQDPDSLLGKVLRLDVDGEDPDRNALYAIPPGNPFAGGGGAPEIYALGLRNPWRFSFDSDTGALWAGDVGQDSFEEINLIEAGGNYGWPIREGAHCFAAESCEVEGLIDPITEYGRDGGISVTGGYVYRGLGNPELADQYVFADFGSGKFFTVAVEGGVTPRPPELLFESEIAPSTLAEDSRGELYVADFVSGALFRLAAGESCDGAAPVGPQSDLGSPSTFQELYDQVLASRCSPCHTVRALGGLSMTTADAAFENLIDVSAVTADCAGRTRVVAGDPDASLLFSKVSGHELCGPKMPLGGELPDAEVEAIRAWIESGAPR